MASAASLYGDSFMRFNIHQLLHLGKAARQMGPLWAHSAFVFESGNGSILNLVTAAKGVPLQIVERALMAQQVDAIVNADKLPQKLTEIAKRLLGEKRVQKSTYVRKVCLLGTGKVVIFTLAEQECFVNMFRQSSGTGQEYLRMICKGKESVSQCKLCESCQI